MYVGVGGAIIVKKLPFLHLVITVFIKEVRKSKQTSMIYTVYADFSSKNTFISVWLQKQVCVSNQVWGTIKNATFWKSIHGSTVISEQKKNKKCKNCKLTPPSFFSSSAHIFINDQTALPDNLESPTRSRPCRSAWVSHGFYQLRTCNFRQICDSMR